MKRAFIIGLLLTLLCCFEVHAQGQFRKPLKATRQSQLGFSNYNIALKLGCPWSYLAKSDLRETTYDGNFGYLIGIAAERNLGKWSVGLEATFAQKGTKMHNEKPYQISLTQDGILKTQYQVGYNVATVRVPVTYYFKGMVKDDKVVPYIFIGPEVDIPLGFNFDLWSFKTESPIMATKRRFDGPTGQDPLPEKAEPFDPGINLSAAAGIGFMSKIRFENSAIIFKFDAAFNYGILNLASEGSRWSQTEGIHAHDAEICFSIVYPIKKILHDACHHIQ